MILEVPEQARGKRLEQGKIDILLYFIDKMIESSEPRRSEYFRGYRRGIQLHQLGAVKEAIQEYYRLHQSHADSGGNHHDAYARGYRDGCKGLKPDEAN
jgi:hypothetical protein